MRNENITSGKNRSYWIDSIDSITYNELTESITTDIVIVGGGIAGITIAYTLIKAGKKVVLIEDGNIGSGETGRTTAHLVTALDDRYYKLERLYGQEKTKMIAASHKAAIDYIESIVHDNKIECGFERLDGYLFLDPTDERDALEKELIAARNAGIKVELLPVTPGMNIKGSSLQFFEQAQFHPLKYLKGLAEAITKLGGSIFTNTHAQKIDEDGIVTSNGFSVKAKHVVVATNTPVSNKFTMHLKQHPYRTYVIGARTKRGSIPKALWWDTGDFSINSDIPPYHYIRLQVLDDQYDLLLCGGEDHLTGLTGDHKMIEEDRYGLIEYWLRKRFDVEDIVYHWSGQVMEPFDSLGYIGKNPHGASNIFIATGDSGNGMTYGTIAGMLIPDLIIGKPNPLEMIYDPSRFKLVAGKTFFTELIEGMVDYLKNKPHDIKSLELSSIKNEEGKIVEYEDHKFGVYRDENSGLHFVEAKCAHLGCIVKWNNDEKSWDCPCHGSRYSIYGKVINGPANSDLKYHSHSSN